MKISSVLLASAQAAPQAERAFIDSESFLAVGSESWWSADVEPGYILKTENGIPAMADAFRAAAVGPRADRINNVANRFEGQMNRLIKNMRNSLDRCDRKSGDRKRRSPSERGYEYGNIEKDFGDGLWWQLAKWTRNSMYEDCPDLAWPLLARIDRFRWIYMRHYCDFVDNNCSFDWALWEDEAKTVKRKNNFRSKKWFVNKYGGKDENGEIIAPALPTSDPYPLPEGYTSTDTEWGTVYYKIHDGLHNIDEARALCSADADFVHLPIPSNSYENDFFFNLVGAQSNYDAWIGISDELSEGVWMGDNDVEQTWFNWNKGEPNNYRNGEHWVELVLSGNSNQNGKWNDYYKSTDPSERIAYHTNNLAICTFTVPGTAPERRCPLGWEEHELTDGGATCLQINKGTYQIDYALNSCTEQGGALAQPTNLADNTLFADLVGYNRGYDLWLAISDVETEGTWLNMNDGSEIEWTNWRGNEPNNWRGKEHYAAMVLTRDNARGLWYDHYSHNHANEADRIAYNTNKAFICTMAI